MALALREPIELVLVRRIHVTEQLHQRSARRPERLEQLGTRARAGGRESSGAVRSPGGRLAADLCDVSKLIELRQHEADRHATGSVSCISSDVRQQLPSSLTSEAVEKGNTSMLWRGCGACGSSHARTSLIGHMRCWAMTVVARRSGARSAARIMVRVREAGRATRSRLEACLLFGAARLAFLFVARCFSHVSLLFKMFCPVL